MTEHIASTSTPCPITITLAFPFIQLMGLSTAKDLSF